MMKIVAVALLALIVCAHAAVVTQEVQTQFAQFTKTHGKVYGDEEYVHRQQVFAANMEKIRKLNLERPRTNFGVTEYADLTAEEFRAARLSTAIEGRPEGVPNAPLYDQAHIDALPTSWDWREKGAVTGVKNQGQCGSCWSFSTTGNVEGQWFLAGNKLTSLSEQNLVDCDHTCGKYRGFDGCDAGCNGGLQPNAFTYIIKNGGIDTEASYPYEGENLSCRFNAANIGAKIDNYTMVSENEEQMMAYLHEHGQVFFTRSTLTISNNSQDNGEMYLAYVDGASNNFTFVDSQFTVQSNTIQEVLYFGYASASGATNHLSFTGSSITFEENTVAVSAGDSDFHMGYAEDAAQSHIYFTGSGRLSFINNDVAGSYYIQTESWSPDGETSEITYSSDACMELYDRPVLTFTNNKDSEFRSRFCAPTATASLVETESAHPTATVQATKSVDAPTPQPPSPVPPTPVPTTTTTTVATTSTTTVAPATTTTTTTPMTTTSTSSPATTTTVAAGGSSSSSSASDVVFDLSQFNNGASSRTSSSVLSFLICLIALALMQ